MGTHKIHRLSAHYGKTIYSVVVEGDLRVLFYIEGDIVKTLVVGTLSETTRDCQLRSFRESVMNHFYRDKNRGITGDKHDATPILVDARKMDIKLDRELKSIVDLTECNMARN